jgi:stage II sporulation protein GA (sporulation sigma-E factor processing peptidase)
MSQYIVYADILLALNFFCDFFLLWTAGRILRRNISLLRILGASLVGAVYGLTPIIPSLLWLSHPFCMFVISLLLLRIAYHWDSPKNFLSLAGVFYLTAFAMAGAALAGGRLLEQNGIILGPQQTLQAGSLLFAVFIAIILGRKGWKALRKSWQKEDFNFNIIIKVGGRSCKLKALIDTGNDLCEPLSGLPVLVAEYQSIKSLLPEYLRRSFEKYGSKVPDQVLHDLSLKQRSDGWLRRLRLIPFASIGNRNGLLLGFRPDMLLCEGIEKKQTNQVMVCISPDGLGNDYQAVINPEILEGGEKYKEASCA